MNGHHRWLYYFLLWFEWTHFRLLIIIMRCRLPTTWWPTFFQHNIIRQKKIYFSPSEYMMIGQRACHFRVKANAQKLLLWGLRSRLLRNFVRTHTCTAHKNIFPSIDLCNSNPTLLFYETCMDGVYGRIILYHAGIFIKSFLRIRKKYIWKNWCSCIQRPLWESLFF